MRRRPRFLRGPRIDEPVLAPIVRTERLVLRPHRMADAAEWFQLQSNPDVLRYLPWPLRDRQESARHLRTRTRQTRLWQSDDFLALAVELDGHLIGDVSLHLRTVSTAGRMAEIGWIIDPDFSRRGYGTEAARAMLALAFDDLHSTLVLAIVDRRNTPSLALADKLAFASAGCERTCETLVVTAAAHAKFESEHERDDMLAECTSPPRPRRAIGEGAR